MISGLLGFVKSIYYSVAGVGSFFTMLFRYIGNLFSLVGYVTHIFIDKYVGFLPSSLAALLVALLIALLALKVLGRE